MKAAVDAYGITIHAVTSNKENWYLKYQPDAEKTPHEDPVSPRNTRKKLFITYIAPIHYNSILPNEPKACILASNGTTFTLSQP